MTDTGKGTLYVAISALLYSLGGICIKLIPWGGMAINGARTGIALVIFAVYMAATKHPLRFNRWVLLGALSTFGTNALFSVANKLTTAANAIVLQFTVPIFVILFAFVFLGQRPTKLDILACVVVFGGIVFFFLDSLQMGGGLGNMLALISGVTYAGVFMMNQMPDGDAISSVFWGAVFSFCTGLPFLMRETEFTPVALTSLMVLAVFQVGLAYVFLCEGLKTTPPVTASLIAGIEPVLNPLWVALFYHETMGMFAMIGGVIVVGGVVAYNVLKVKME